MIAAFLQVCENTYLSTFLTEECFLPFCRKSLRKVKNTSARTTRDFFSSFLVRQGSSTLESLELLLDTEGIMRKIVVSEFVSLDNVMQAPGGAEEDTEGGFTQGGWTAPFWHDDIGAHFFEAMSQSDALLLGRKTWQIHGGAI